MSDETIPDEVAEAQLRAALEAQEKSAEIVPEAPSPRAPLPAEVAQAGVKALVQIQADSHGALRPKNMDELWRMAKMTYTAGMLPATLDTPEKVMVAMQFLAEIGLPGIAALRNVMVVNGLPTLWGDLPLTLVRKSGKLAKFKEWSFDAEGVEICPANKNLKAVIDGAACMAQRVTYAPDGSPLIEEKETWFTVADARTAGLWGGKVWGKYPRRMLQMRPRSQMLKDLFGDVLLGAALLEYDHNLIADGDANREAPGFGAMPVQGPRVLDELNAIGKPEVVEAAQ